MGYYYYFLEGQGMIRIRAKRKPFPRPKPYACQEWFEDKWQMPCFPEIGFGKLKTMTYIGSTFIGAKP